MRFDPAGYPGERPAHPALVWRGRTWQLELDPAPGTTVRPVAPEGRAAPVLAAVKHLRWSVAYGANADPGRLVDKGLDRAGALLLPAVLYGYQEVWEARRSRSTGAVPATLAPAPGRRFETWVLGVRPDDADRLDASEYRGSNYVLGRVGEVAVAVRWRISDALAYGPGPGTRVLTTVGEAASLATVDQAEARALLRAGPATNAADPLPGAVDEGWPATPMEDLPLAVYGTLQPAGRRWSRIAALVVEAGPVRLPGRLYDSGHGWPAMQLAAPDAAERVHGHLLRPRSVAAAHELYRRTDAIEGAPDLFRRVAVPVARPGGATVMAATYAWADGTPPGRRLDGGRWRPDDES